MYDLRLYGDFGVPSDLGMFLPVCVHPAYTKAVFSGAGLVAATDAITLCHLNKRTAVTPCAIPKQQKVVNQ